MDKVRFACPRCQTIMQTGVEKVGYDVACPHCAHRFRLIESSDPSVDTSGPSNADSATMPPSAPPMSERSEESSSASPQAFTPRKRTPISSSPAVGSTHSTPIISRVPKSQPQAGFCCPYCQTTRPPKWKSEVSQVGWIVFAILLVTTCVFCFVGLFIRDKYRVCSQCKIRLN